MPATEFQTVRQKTVNRTKHVWRFVKDRYRDMWKCVLCGGISAAPSDDCDPTSYEKVTENDRSLCPIEVGRKKLQPETKGEKS